MKINELMVGDHCLAVDEDKKHKCIVSVLELRYDKAWLKVGIWGETLPYDRLEPIELTERILKENGFVGVELTDSYELNTDYYEIEVWKYSDELWVVNVQWIEFSSTPESKATVSYVHQLQHLLRLCGIEKEIEL